MKTLSLAVCLAATTLATQWGCHAAKQGSGLRIDAASADARIYVSGAD